MFIFWSSFYSTMYYFKTLSKNFKMPFLQKWSIFLLQIQAPKTAAYYISPIEIGVFWLKIKCLKSATRLLNRVCVGRRGLDLSKEVLWVSVCQRAAKLPAGKVGGLKKNSAMRPGAGESVSNPAAWQNFFSNLELCQLVTQLPFDIQRPTVLL